MLRTYLKEINYLSKTYAIDVLFANVGGALTLRTEAFTISTAHGKALFAKSLVCEEVFDEPFFEEIVLDAFTVRLQ